MITTYEPRETVAPYYPAVVDIETDRRTGHEILVTFGPAAPADAERDAWSYPCWQDFWTAYLDYVDEQKRSLESRTLYAHNGGGFDFPHLLDFLTDSGIPLDRIKITMADGIFLAADIRVDKKTVIHLRDSMRLIPGGLAALTKSFDVPHKKIDIHGQVHHELAETDPELFQQYARNDVLGLQEVLYAFWTMLGTVEGNVGKLAMTIPGMAMRMFRKTLTEEIWTTSSPKLKEFERRSYTGGRTQCFQVGKTNVNVYDINSMYPAIMHDLEVPIDYAGGWVSEYHGKCGLYHIRYTQTHRSLPAVLRPEQASDFAYEGEGVYTNIEIDKLLQVGGVIDCIRGYRYFRTARVFRPFIAKWYGLRRTALENGDEGFAYVCKILMNSLYGKFGQKEKGWNIYREDWEVTLARIRKGQNVDLTYTRPPYESGYVLVEEERHAEYTFTAIASFITSASRVALYDQMETAIRQGGVVWYCDTDSIHVAGATLPTSLDLGALKLEYAGPATYTGKKNYDLINKDKHPIKAKAFPAGTVTHEMMEALVTGNAEEFLIKFSTLPTEREVILKRRPPAVNVERQRTLRVTGPKPLE